MLKAPTDFVGIEGCEEHSYRIFGGGYSVARSPNCLYLEIALDVERVSVGGEKKNFAYLLSAVNHINLELFYNVCMECF